MNVASRLRPTMASRLLPRKARKLSMPLPEVYSAVAMPCDWA